MKQRSPQTFAWVVVCEARLGGHRNALGVEVLPPGGSLLDRSYQPACSLKPAFASVRLTVITFC